MEFLKPFIATIVGLTAISQFAVYTLKHRDASASDAHVSVPSREVRAPRISADPAPAECLNIARELFAYLFEANTDLVSDLDRQETWLSTGLRDELRRNARLARSRQERYPDLRTDSPTNDSFIGSWDRPQGFAIVGTRAYGPRAIIDVEFIPGPGNNYEGVNYLQSFIFVLDDTAWKLDDVYSYSAEYRSNPEGLHQRLRTESDNWEEFP